MPQIVQQGSLNTTALVVPDLYVQIVPPQNLLINGVPTNVMGVVGTAQWGPVNQPMIIGSMAQYAASFGAIQNRTFDMGTTVALAVLQGAANFRCVRVTDGTDSKAQVVIQSTGLTVPALYSGTLGNSATIAVGPGARPGSFRLVVGIPGFTPEVYNNIGAGPTTTVTSAVTSSITVPVANSAGITVGMSALGAGLTGSPTVASVPNGTSITLSATQTIAAGASLSFALAGNAVWVAMAAALNNGNAINRGPSNIVGNVTAGALTTAPTTNTYPLSGGTDGVTTITTSVMLGTDTTPRTGMFALRGQGCSIGVLADLSDSASWTQQIAYGLSEGTYMITTSPSGSAIQNGTSGTVDLKALAGADSYALKVMHGDWLFWLDNVNQVVRLVSPQGFAAGILANLSPEQSSLNKAMFGIIGSQKSGLVPAQNTTYAVAELQVLGQNGIDVIANPLPAGNIWGCRFGHNSSSNVTIHGDNYTRLTNYIAATLAAGMGQYIGKLINTTLFGQVRATLMNFFTNMLVVGQLGSTTGALPFSVVCDISNNPPSLTGLGYLTANVQVQYQAITEFFIVNLEGGQTVTVLQQSNPASGVPGTPTL
jgi:uncharacterized protein